jgi:predicted dehydrogenase
MRQQMNDGLTRRRFLKGTAAASAALAFGLELQAGEGLAVARLGFVGVGARGTGLLKTVLDVPGAEVRAVCDIDEAAARNAQALVGARTGATPDAYTDGDRDWASLCARDDLDAVVIATPWEWHAPIAIAAMRAGKYVGTEVPACGTVKECWDLVRTSEKTGMPCMMLENVNYFRSVLAMTRMAHEGVLGEITHAQAGYQHDCRFLAFTDDGRLTWRGKHFAEKNGNLYPTHAIGPVAWWMDINRGDRFVRLSSASTVSRSLKDYARAKFGADHPLAKRDYAQGDVNTSLIETANGRTITLYYNTSSPRPYDLTLRLQGTKGIIEGGAERVYLEGKSPDDQWEPFGPYQERDEHPLWDALEEPALKNGGHGGCDYITLYEFVKAVRTRAQTPQDVYDAAAWSAMVPLSIESVSKHGQSVEVPDFTEGKWKTNPRLRIAVD